jgi:hypothetical protein
MDLYRSLQVIVIPIFGLPLTNKVILRIFPIAHNHVVVSSGLSFFLQDLNSLIGASEVASIASSISLF